MKAELANLEREIAIGIQKNQLKQQQPAPPSEDTAEILGIQEVEKMPERVHEKEIVMEIPKVTERPRSRMHL